MKKSNSNTLIIVLLSILILAVLGFGVYFVLRDINRPVPTGQNNAIPTVDPGSTPAGDTTPQPSDDTNPTSSTDEIDAGITYAERQGNEFHVEVQANGAVEGKCEITLIRTGEAVGRTETEDLESYNKISVCDEDFSLKGTNPGEHLVRVVIRTYDGRTKTLEKTVNIQ